MSDQQPMSAFHKKELDDLRLRYEVEIAQVILGTARNFVPAYERSAERLMWGVGATTGLIVANLGSLRSIFEGASLRVALAMFSISLLFGMLVLIRARSASLNMTFVDVTSPALFKTLNQYDQDLAAYLRDYQLNPFQFNPEPPRVEAVLKQLQEAAPIWRRWQIAKRARKGAKDPLLTHKRAGKDAVIAIQYCGMQVVTASLAIVVLILGMEI